MRDHCTQLFIEVEYLRFISESKLEYCRKSGIELRNLKKLLYLFKIIILKKKNITISIGKEMIKRVKILKILRSVILYFNLSNCFLLTIKNGKHIKMKKPIYFIGFESTDKFVIKDIFEKKAPITFIIFG